MHRRHHVDHHHRRHHTSKNTRGKCPDDPAPGPHTRERIEHRNKTRADERSPPCNNPHDAATQLRTNLHTHKYKPSQAHPPWGHGVHRTGQPAVSSRPGGRARPQLRVLRRALRSPTSVQRLPPPPRATGARRRQGPKRIARRKMDDGCGRDQSSGWALDSAMTLAERL